MRAGGSNGIVEFAKLVEHKLVEHKDGSARSRADSFWGLLANQNMPVSHPTTLMPSTAALRTVLCCFAAITGTLVYSQRSPKPYDAMGSFGMCCVAAQNA